MKYKTMKLRDKYEKVLSDNKRMNKKLIELNSKLNICQQKYLSTETAFDISQKLVQHLKTENQLLRSSASDVYPLSIPLGPPMSTTLAITDGLEIGEINASNENQSADNNPTSHLCKSDLIAVQYENEIKELRTECDLLDSLPYDSVVISYEDQLNAKSHLSSSSESEPEFDQQMDVDFDVMSSKMSETSEHKTDSKCNICGKRFQDMNTLNEHKLLHKSSDGLQIRCAEDFCGHQFDSKHDLKRHLKNIHRSGHKNTKFSSLKAKFNMNCNQNNRIFDCKDCNETFNSIESLRFHQKSVHNIVSTFKCKFSGCDQKFEKSSELRAHEGIHRKQKSTIEFKPSPIKTPVLSETKVNGDPESTPKSVPKRQFACQYNGCQASYVHKTSLKKHEEKSHPKGIVDLTQTVGTTATTEGVAVVATSPQNIGSKLELLNLFLSQQQQNALL